MAAGITKLQASHGSKNALLKVGNATFLGGTGGTAPLGPQGVVPGSEATTVPDGVRQPRDFGECLVNFGQTEFLTFSRDP